MLPPAPESEDPQSSRRTWSKPRVRRVILTDTGGNPQGVPSSETFEQSGSTFGDGRGYNPAS